MIVYADDFVVLVKGNARSQLESEANEKIKIFNHLCTYLVLRISEHKRTAMLFRSNLLENRRPIFNINNQTISIKKNLTYLGMILDSKLKFSDHLIHLRSRIQQLCRGFGKTSFFNKGLRSSILKMWYNIVIVWQILYASDIWSPFINAHGLRKAKSIQ